MSDNDAADLAFAALCEPFAQPISFQSYRIYELTFSNGEPIFTLSEFDRVMEELTGEI